MDDTRVIEGLRALDLEFTPEQMNQLRKYSDEIELWNKKLNLVSQFTEEDFAVRHLLDSLAGLKTIQSLGGDSWADVGSGAGLPGIPLAIADPTIKWTLIERSAKRVGFLRNVVVLLDLADRVTVIQGDLKEVRDSFDGITFRAFRQIEDFVPLLTKILKPGGVLAAYKGRRETVLMEKIHLEKTGHRCVIRELSVPFLKEERHILEIRIID